MIAVLLTVLLILAPAGCAKEENHVIWRPGDAPALSNGQDAEPASELETEPQEQILQRDDGLEYAIFPMEYLHITQTSGEGTHLYNWAVDFAGVDTGIDDFYAPFTLRIVRIQKGYNIVWAQSVEKVHLANGGLDYVTVLLEHSNNIDDLYVGQVIPQGQVFYSEGTAGNASGNHVHCEFGLGEYVNEGCYHAEDGRVAANHGIAANEILFLTASTQVIDEGGFTWQTLPLTTEKILSGGYHCQGEGHIAVSEKIVKVPGCTEEGACQYTCQLCGCTVTEAIAATGHTAIRTQSIEPAEDVCGADFYTCDVCGDSWLELQWQNAPTWELSDVTDDPYIAYVCQQGLMEPFDGAEFLPDGYVPRIELLTTLYQLGGVAGYGCDYSDVKDDDPDVPIIGWATATGLAEATSENKFTPEVAVTCLDAIVMVTGFMEQAPVIAAAEPEDWAVETGMFSSADNLDCALTRAEAARLLTLMQLLPALGA